MIARNAMREIEVFLPLSFLGAQAAEGAADSFLTIFSLLWSGIFLFFPLFNRDRLRVGDLVAGTWVVRNEKAGLSADLVGSAYQRGEPSRRRRSSSTASTNCRRSRTCCATRTRRRSRPSRRTIRTKADLPDDGDDYGFLVGLLCGAMRAPGTRADGWPPAREQVHPMTTKTIFDFATPALILDRVRLEANASRMRDKVRSLGVELRPHVKTSKSIDVLRVLAGGASLPITVSTLAEARYFFEHGVTDILYAVGIAPVKLPEVAHLIRAGCKLRIILDTPEAAE